MNSSGRYIDRRGVILSGAVGAAAAGSVPSARAAAAAAAAGETFVPAQTVWPPAPAPVPAKAEQVALSRARLWVWDTGGPGEAVVLLHPYTGSHAVWEHQQPVFARAGYRVIGYSRRGFFGSDPHQPGVAPDDVGDLVELLDKLGLRAAHLVGSAAGAFVAMAFTAAHPDRVLSLVIASSLVAAQDEQSRAMLAGLLPEGWLSLPAAFRELGPSYRAANKPGAERWATLEKRAMLGPPPERMGRAPTISAEALSRFPPVLMLTGDADLYSPPSVMRAAVRAVRGAELAIFAEAGHAVFWEQPDGFNAVVLDFIKRRGTARAR